MVAIHETAYPRIKTKLSDDELDKIFTPSNDDITFAKANTRVPRTRLGLLILLKSFQRLGYFPQLEDLPQQVIDHIAKVVKISSEKQFLIDYETNGYRYRHIPLTRNHLAILPYSKGGQRVLVRSLAESAQSKDDLADLINCGLEALVAKRYEVPAFSTFVKAAQKVRYLVNKATYLLVMKNTSSEQQTKLEELFLTDDNATSFWHDIKQDPGPATVKNMRNHAARLKWLRSLKTSSEVLEDVPFARYRRFVAEARSLDSGRMKALSKNKRITLASALVCDQIGTAHDDLADMFIKSCNKMHWAARRKLETLKQKNQAKADDLVTILATITNVWSTASKEERAKQLEQVFAVNKPKEILKKCENHLAYAGNNWLPLLPNLFNARRQNFLRFLELAELRSSSEDQRIELAIRFVLAKQKSKAQTIKTADFVNVTQTREEDVVENLGWIPDKWWSCVTGVSASTKRDVPESLNRKMFEICLCTCVMQELKSGDLFVPGGEKFGDWRKELVSSEDYQGSVKKYCKRVGLPTNPNAIVDKVRQQLVDATRKADDNLPNNQHLDFDGKNLHLKRLRKQPQPNDFAKVEREIAKNMPLTNIPQILVDTDRWIGWTRYFKPLSGFKGKLMSPRARYIGTTFCYGCNLGPTQAARSLEGFDRKQIAWVDERHVGDEDLQNAITLAVNEYKKFDLPKKWGDGSSASADGTQWDIYEKNLLSEYHIRYGGWGGIGYYHVSDTYIALFSNFISCGVWEGIHILDGAVENKSEIQPDTLHADTQGQSEAIFGLSSLLGIRLMPRIRNWKELTFYLAQKDSKLDNLQSLFSGHINWESISRHLPDMLRIAISISHGKVAPSTILRRLNSASRKSKLYLAFRELGRAVRTIFLLDYINDIDLRRKIQAATNISEEWNGFIQWIAFGGDRLRKSDRAGQQKIIRYNHLVANLVVLHNVVHLTKSLNVFALDNGAPSPEVLSALGPYRTGNINRFGEYPVDEEGDDLDIREVNLSFNNSYLT